MNIDSIVFDLGSVLVDWNPSGAYPEISNPEERAFFFSEVCGVEYLSLTDTGISWDEADEITCRKFPEWSVHIRNFRSRWPDMLIGPIEGTVTLMESLKKKYKVYALTNWASDTFDMACTMIPFFNTFEGVVVSGKEGTLKPDRKIFEILINRYTIDPSRSLFIDDRKENTAAGAAVGFNTHTFTSPQLLEHFLKTEKIL